MGLQARDHSLISAAAYEDLLSKRGIDEEEMEEEEEEAEEEDEEEGQAGDITSTSTSDEEFEGEDENEDEDEDVEDMEDEDEGDEEEEEEEGEGQEVKVSHLGPCIYCCWEVVVFPGNVPYGQLPRGTSESPCRHEHTFTITSSCGWVLEQRCRCSRHCVHQILMPYCRLTCGLEAGCYITCTCMTLAVASK